MFKKIITKIEKHDTKLVAFIALLVSALSITFFYSRNELLLYGDARTHLNIAREVIDNLSPGATQLGGIWLPLFHILELPLIWNNYLWQTGIAGSIISGGAFIGSGIYLYLLMKKITKSNFSSFIAFLVYILNPNLLYMQSIPMTEVLLLFTVIGSIYYFYNWLKHNSLNNLILSAFFVFLGTLVRYDAWFLGLIEILVIVIWVKFKQKIPGYGGKAALFSYIGLLGIFLWFVWNYILWNNCLYFLFGEGSAHTQQLGLEIEGKLPALFNLKVAFLTYLWDCIGIVGLTAMSITTLSFLILIKRRIIPEIIVIILFLSIIFFNILSLFLGISVVFVPEMQNHMAMFNVRYGLIVLPLIAIISFSVFKNRLYNLFVFFIIIITFANMVYVKKVITYNDPKIGSSNYLMKYDQLSNWFIKNYDKGLVLISFGSLNNALTQKMGLDLKIYVHEGTRTYWTKALISPQQITKWIIISKNDVLDKNFHNRGKLNKYIKVYESQGSEVYRLADAEGLKKYKNNNTSKTKTEQTNIDLNQKAQAICEYTTNLGDSLWTIATSKLGTGMNYLKIMDLNNKNIDPNDHIIHPNEKLIIPCS